MLLEQGLGTQPPREVTAPLEIQSLLKALHAARTPLEVRFEDRAQTFQSYLVELDTASGMLYIDGLIPSVGAKWMTQRESFRADACSAASPWRCRRGDARRAERVAGARP